MVELKHKLGKAHNLRFFLFKLYLKCIVFVVRMGYYVYNFHVNLNSSLNFAFNTRGVIILVCTMLKYLLEIITIYVLYVISSPKI